MSNVRDNTKNQQHTHAMNLLKKNQAVAKGLGLSAYAPIVRVFNRLPDNERRRLRFKFNIAHLVATEKLSFLKYSQICELEVDLGASYLNETPGKSFNCLLHCLVKAG